ncbi:hypothetical protein HMPREF9538_01186 [Klebsiella sp. MS 92-3]|nr:hypothetical protein HMPREF9538_01186 [Klebsiella sp. MS 92-3]
MTIVFRLEGELLAWIAEMLYLTGRRGRELEATSGGYGEI